MRSSATAAAGLTFDEGEFNPGIDVDALLRHWVPYVGGSRSSITVAIDWTSFDADGQTTIMLSLLCGNGRATPLAWLTVETATPKARRNDCEYQVLVRLAEVLPAAVRVNRVTLVDVDVRFPRTSGAYASLRQWAQCG